MSLLSPLAAPFKRILPQSLFGRALLILVVPLVAVQLVTAYFFFERHWDSVTRNMAASLAGETAYFVNEIKEPGEHRTELVRDADEYMGVVISFKERGPLPANSAGDKFSDFYHKLDSLLEEEFSLQETADGSTLHIYVELPDAQAVFKVSIKRLASPTTYIFLMWTAGISILLLFIALLFLRNQIRPIVRLADAAEAFGRGMEMENFRPSGALEVRRAARAFIIMRERIKRQISTRVQMLAGISHDLRTPLARMKLQLAMLPQGRDTAEMGGDVAQMERMIQEYLDFASGEGGEDTSHVTLSEFLEEAVMSYRRSGQDVPVTLSRDVSLQLRTGAFLRAMHNLIGNALRYGKHCSVTARVSEKYVEIDVEDDGPGIPPESRMAVFQPFTRLDASRNLDTGGAGLGLTIARDIVLGHGGEITLSNSDKMGGLKATIRLPL